MIKPTATLLVISGDEKITNFMQCCDVFDKGKVIGEEMYFTVSYDEGEKLTLERATILIDATKNALIKANSQLVSFVHLVEINDGKKIIKNEGQVLPYINKKVRCVSSGKNWYMLCEYIERVTGLKVTTNQYKFITGIGIKIEGAQTLTVKVNKKTKKNN